MGVELHITRAEYWAENEHHQITSEEWLTYVQSDPELQLDPRNGKHHVLWLGKSSCEEPWLSWSSGNISTKWPDPALYQKMLKIAIPLNATVQDDEGTLYTKDTDWTFDYVARRARHSP